jgi:hypothetical protein
MITESAPSQSPNVAKDSSASFPTAETEPVGQTAPQNPAAWLTGEAAQQAREKMALASAPADPAEWLKGPRDLAESAATSVPEAGSEYYSSGDSPAPVQAMEEAAPTGQSALALRRAMEYVDLPLPYSHAGPRQAESVVLPPPRVEPVTVEVEAAPSEAIFGFPLLSSDSEDLEEMAMAMGFDGAAMGLDSLEHLESVDLDKPDPSLGVYGDSTKGNRVTRRLGGPFY